MKSIAFKKLKDKQIEFIVNSKEYKEAIEDLCTSIVEKSKEALNEATVVSTFELELFSFIKEVLGLQFQPTKESSVSTSRHITKGRVDSKIGTLIFEFKHCSRLKSKLDRESAYSQICIYLEGLYKSSNTDHIGILTDGIFCNTIKMESGNIVQSGFQKLSSLHFDQIIKYIVLLEKRSLSPENLVEDFCTPLDSSISTELSRILYDVLKENPTSKTSMLFQEWKELFRLAHDDKSKQKAIIERKDALEKTINKPFTNNDDEYRSLYAIQTTYAIIVKIIAYKVVSKIQFNRSLIAFNDLASSDSGSLRIQMHELEEGALFRNIGIGNLLEGDFFSWYSSEDQWNKPISDYIRRIFSVLVPYEDKAIFEDGSNVTDLFKDLFMHIIPEKVRHSLGEYYTPPWLADDVIKQAFKRINNSEWKALDPCAGSGTFLTILIKKVIEQSKGKSDNEKLHEILGRVKGIDLNPLAVLTSRINYFINISPLISNTDKFEIPVYLGDSSYVPSEVEFDKVACIEYRITTIQGEIRILLPKSIIQNPELFSAKMTLIEDYIHNFDSDSIQQELLSLVSDEEKTNLIKKEIGNLATKFVDLEQKHWNGIWARIVTNFLTTANIGDFDLIVSNPPWIDWKNLPAGYRERIKGLCISRNLFSGDKLTGGINLNVCALIANVSAQNWLNEEGILAFLMPQSIIFQQTYEGFRHFELDEGKRLYLQEVTDWTKSGHPFSPVQQKFLTYLYSNESKNYCLGIEVKQLVKKGGTSLKEYSNRISFEDVKHLFTSKVRYIGQVHDSNSIFTYADRISDLESYRNIIGKSNYIGREGIEFYPQEVFLLEYEKNMKEEDGNIFVNNFQNKKSKYRVPQQTNLLEHRYLHPLIRGRDIRRFHLDNSNLLAPFPYDKSNPRSPLSISELSLVSPNLMRYLTKFKSIIEKQTDYNSKIIGKKNNSTFYALARVGKYSFADNYVVFRDNTKWQSTVVSKLQTPWGEKKRPQFQNHAVSICQDETGRFITSSEAHYICAILNSPIVTKYIMNSSDSRSFKIRPQINIPIFDPTNPLHEELSKLSIHAHKVYDNLDKIRKVDKKLDELVVNL